MESTMKETGRYSLAEEIANSVTHGVGALLAVAGLAVLTAFASLYGDGWHVVSCSVFGATLILQYVTSTLYHSIPLPRAKSVLRVLDHNAIFLLIAGTYTPFTLISLRGPWGWSLFGVIWGLAVLGVLLRTVLPRRKNRLATMIYLAMGWAVVVAVKPMIQFVPAGGLGLLLAGGLAYTLGAVFYLWEKLPFNHAVWHLFVLAGSAFHFFAVLLYVIPLR
ncbi:MAG TPA: hemolysin III family protein [Desulfomicrobiaceae bacterium]|nr:hemolysin III family protein [Desulfomicrobiaceae bacterium]